jgi:hypothetical protein
MHCIIISVCSVTHLRLLRVYRSLQLFVYIFFSRLALSFTSHTLGGTLCSTTPYVGNGPSMLVWLPYVHSYLDCIPVFGLFAYLVSSIAKTNTSLIPKLEPINPHSTHVHMTFVLTGVLWSLVFVSLQCLFSNKTRVPETVTQVTCTWSNNWNWDLRPVLYFLFTEIPRLWLMNIAIIFIVIHCNQTPLTITSDPPSFRPGVETTPRSRWTHFSV